MNRVPTGFLLCFVFFNVIESAEERKELPTTEDVYHHIIDKMNLKLTQPAPRRLQITNAYVKKVILHQKSQHIDVTLGDLDRKQEAACGFCCCSNDPSMIIGVDLSAVQVGQLPQKNSKLTNDFRTYFRSHKNYFPATLSHQNLKS